MPDPTYSNWRLARDPEDILWLSMDKAEAEVNTLSFAVFEELDEILREAAKDLPAALVICSAKKGGFCVGADINEFSSVNDPVEIKKIMADGQAILRRLEDLPVPTIALIHGICFGGGLELALSCTYRIGVEGARLALPEIKLGVHPGLGGTAKLTHLINPVQAMTMMLTGKTIYDKKAKKIGLIDDLVPERHVAAAVRSAIAGKLTPRRHSMKENFYNSAPMRALAAKEMRREVAAKASKKHYPAPYALIDLWESYGTDRTIMAEEESISFSKLLGGNCAKNLIHVFFLQQRLKELASADSDISHVHVIGAGTMGAEIAAWCALKGYKVTLSDMHNDALARAVKTAKKMAISKHKTSAQIRDLLDRLTPDPKGLGTTKADLIIEAVPEVLDLKKKIYHSIEPRMKEGAILATNTSSIPLEQLADGLEAPQRLVGLHFFNPVAQMMVVEVVHHDKLSADVLARAANFVKHIDKLPVPVQSQPGFLVNRALTPYMVEAILLIDEGVAKETIDKAATDFGMPIGPVELLDQVGLDIGLEVVKSLKDKLGDQKIPDWFKGKIKDKHLGKKTGQGLYVWKDGKAQKSKKCPAPSKEITDRLILPMLNVCAEAHRTGVVEDTEILDGAMIFATGFAPFTGGPIHYARSRGVHDIIGALEQLADKHGSRFAPDPGWETI